MSTDYREPLAAALRSLRANKMRSALTTLGIVIGVAAVIVVVSLVDGLRSSVLKQVEKAGSQTLFVRPVMPGDMPYPEFTKIKDRDLTLEDMKALERTTPFITSVTPIHFNGSEAKAGGRTASANVVMTDDTYFDQNGLELAQGRNFVPSDLRLGAKVAVVGPRVLEKLGLEDHPLGRIIQTPQLSLEIIGVLKEQGSQMGNDPDSVMVIPLTTGRPYLTDAQRRQLFIQVRIDPRIPADDGAERVEDSLRRIKGLRDKEIAGFKVFSPKQIAGIVTTITGAITAVAGGMVSIALLVGGIGIMNIMLVSVTERTREIGTRKAVGARRKDILLQFLIEAALLSLLGGAMGIALGYGLGAAAGQALLGTVGGIPLWALVSAVAVPAAIGLLFGLYPAAKASKLDPIEALRYE